MYVIIAVLYVLGVVLGVAGFVGVMICLECIQDSDDWEEMLFPSLFLFYSWV